MKRSAQTKADLMAQIQALRRELDRQHTAETDAAQAEEAMWETQVAVLALFNNLPGMAYRTAIDPASTHGYRVEFVSAGCLELTGYPAAAYVDDPRLYRSKVTHPEDQERALDTIRLAQETHAPYALTYRIRKASGEVRWMEERGTGLYDADGALAAREGYICDVTQHMEDLAEIRRQHAQLQRLTRAVEQAGELVMIGDEQGRIQYVNAAFEKVTGYRREEVLGRAPGMVTTDQAHVDFFRKVRGRLLRGDVWRGTYVSPRKDGSLFEVEATVSPVFSPGGAFEGFVAQQREAGDRRQAPEDERQVQKLEVLGMVAGNFVHDFNNLLQAIIGYGQHALEAEAGSAALKGHLERLLEASHRARRLAAEFLGFLKQPGEEPRALPIRPVVNQAVGLLRASLPANLSIAVDAGPEDLVVHGCAARLTQILVSLAVGAARALRQTGGTLDISLSRAVGMPAGTDAKAALECRIACKPASPAVAAAEPQDPAGTALGLAVIADSVRELGGTLTVATRPRAPLAADIRLFLPLSNQPGTPQPAAPAAPVATAAARGERIMFVDDEEMLVELATMELEDLGYRVTPFTSPLQAIEAFRADPGGVDLVIADQTMPGLTGFELSRQMLRLRPGLPIILITGYSEIVDELQARAIGIRDYLIKPITPETLGDAIRRAIESPTPSA